MGQNSKDGARTGGKGGTQSTGGVGGAYSSTSGGAGTFGQGGATVAYSTNWYVGGGRRPEAGLADGAGPGGGPGRRPEVQDGYLQQQITDIHHRLIQEEHGD